MEYLSFLIFLIIVSLIAVALVFSQLATITMSLTLEHTFVFRVIIAELKDKIKLAKIENKELSYDEILDSLPKTLKVIRLNLDKVDKSIYPQYDSIMCKNVIYKIS